MHLIQSWIHFQYTEQPAQALRKCQAFEQTPGQIMNSCSYPFGTHLTVGNSSEFCSHICFVSSSCTLFKFEILLREAFQNNIIFKQTFHF